MAGAFAMVGALGTMDVWRWALANAVRALAEPPTVVFWYDPFYQQLLMKATGFRTQTHG
jgi:hypothetical protein